MFLAKAHHFYLDKLASETKQTEIWGCSPQQTTSLQNAPQATVPTGWFGPLWSLLILVTEIRQNCTEIGSSSLYGNA